MNAESYLPLAWCDSEIIPVNLVKLPRDTELDRLAVSISHEVLCFSTQPLFFDDFEAAVLQSVADLGLSWPAMTTGEGTTWLREEIRRLHIRNKAYGWVRCLLLIRSDHVKLKMKLYLFLQTCEAAFDKEQLFWQLCLLSRFPRPVGAGMSFPVLDSAYRRLALREVQLRGCHDGIMMTDRGQVAGTCYGNLFVIMGNQVRTPALDCGARPIAGRKWVIDTLKEKGFQVEETSCLQVVELYQARELFVLAPDGLYAVKGLDTARYYDDVRPVLLDAFHEQLKTNE